jgi:2-polyprenyl-3-methyl-5-hydroxy-6-metoxy-1,4-benzoquinol methylase
MEYLVNYYDEAIRNGREKIKVLDIGSYDVNGSYRKIFSDSKYEYTGLDMAAGPNVDIVPDSIYDWKEIGDNSYDLVVSGQTFEHIEYPWLTIKEIERVLYPGGGMRCDCAMYAG